MISSDLTFITNENARSLAERFRVLLGENTQAFDCLVGYFYLSGFRRLASALQPTEKIRIVNRMKVLGLTERFSKPFPLDRLESLDIRHPLLSPRRISDAQFATIYSHGCDLP